MDGTGLNSKASNTEVPFLYELSSIFEKFQYYKLYTTCCKCCQKLGNRLKKELYWDIINMVLIHGGIFTCH